MYRIAIDGGALTPDINRQYGTYTTSREIIHALGIVDLKNTYTIYTLNKFKIDLPENFTFKVINPSRGFMSVRIPVEETMHKTDYFLALNQAIPLYTPAKIIALCHGLSFMEYPQLYPDSAGKMKQQVDAIVKNAHTIIVSSSKVKTALNNLYGVDQKVLVELFGIPHEFQIRQKKFKKKNFVLFVGMDHPIKDIAFLFEAFREFIKNSTFARFKFILVGVSHIYVPYDLKHAVIVVPYAHSMAELQQYYAETQCTISASMYESFNMPLLESLSQNTPAVATAEAVIPELQNFVSVTDKIPQTFAKRIQEVLAHPPATDLLTLEKKFSWIKFAKHITGLYEKK
jgi:glycosyltransferase involved in cell wall biosynthesis